MAMKIGVVGIGHIGLPLVATFANVGYNVIGIDIDKEKVDNLNKTFNADLYEPGLSETLKRCRDKIEFTHDCDYLMKECHVVIITIGTPLHDNDEPNLDHLKSVIDETGKRLRKGQVIILKSTVIPGTTRDMAAKLEEASGLKAGTDFYIAFCPERTIEGLALHELYFLPKIIGGINKESTEKAEEVIRKLGSRIVKVSCPEIAELCKLIDNMYRSLNIAFANEIGNICEKLCIDAYEMSSAVNHAYDRTRIFNPGLGADGPCLSKDPKILKHCAEKLGLGTEVIDACILRNDDSTIRIASLVSNYIKDKGIKNPRISLIGLAFKGFPETDDIRGSPAIKIHEKLGGIKNAEFRYYDPVITEFSGRPMCRTLDDCIKDSNAVLFLTNHPHITNIDMNRILKCTGRPLLIVDCWHNLTRKPEEKGVEFFRIGDGSS